MMLLCFDDQSPVLKLAEYFWKSLFCVVEIDVLKRFRRSHPNKVSQNTYDSGRA